MSDEPHGALWWANRLKVGLYQLEVRDLDGNILTNVRTYNPVTGEGTRYKDHRSCDLEPFQQWLQVVPAETADD